MAQFQILYPYSATEWRPLTTEFHFAPCGDEQYYWPSFDEAEAARKRLAARAPDSTFRITLAGADSGDVDWQTRERLRFGDGTYQPTPWHEEPWYQERHGEHFCHVSTEQAGKVAFTENAAKGQVDRQLVMSPGRYLHRYFADALDNNAIEGWCARLSVLLKENELKITQDAQEIEDVYVGGPDSCMAHEADEFESPCHPVRVYAGPETALAYIGARNDATARSVVWPARKIFTSIYGDVSRLRLLLEAEGYSEGSLNGARIRRIAHHEGFVVPYIDRGGNLEDDGEYLIIGYGSISCDSTTGLADVPWYCPRCSNDESPHQEVYSADGEHEEWCYDCFRNHTTWCEHNELYYSDDENFITVYCDGNTRTILEDSADDHGAVYVGDRYEWWDKSCCGQCAASGDWFHVNDLSEYQGELLCEACLPEPFDDDDAALLNAHVLAHGDFLRAIAAIQVEVAKWQVAGECARADALKRARDAAEQHHAVPVHQSGAPAHATDLEAHPIPDGLVPAIAMPAQAPAGTLSQAGV